MTEKELEEKGLRLGDMLYVYLRSNVLKVGTFRGVSTPPVGENVCRLCIGLEPQDSIFEWVRLDYVKAIDVVGADR